jgi:hypothetical protein
LIEWSAIWFEIKRVIVILVWSLCTHSPGTNSTKAMAAMLGGHVGVPDKRVELKFF